MAGLSTHVLDTSKGKPAAELKIELYKILDTEKILIKTVSTNEDGRIEKEGSYVVVYAHRNSPKFGKYAKNDKNMYS